MPYLANHEHRRQLQADYVAETPAELNYQISKAVHDYIEHSEGGLKYARINDVIGALESAKLEFYRTVAGPYEDGKRAENGSVSELDNTGGW